MQTYVKINNQNNKNAERILNVMGSYIDVDNRNNAKGDHEIINTYKKAEKDSRINRTTFLVILS